MTQSFLILYALSHIDSFLELCLIETNTPSPGSPVNVFKVSFHSLSDYATAVIPYLEGSQPFSENQTESPSS